MQRYGKPDPGLSLPTLGNNPDLNHSEEITAGANAKSYSRTKIGGTSDPAKLLGPNTSFDGNAPYGDKGVAVEVESLKGLGNGDNVSVPGKKFVAPPNAERASCGDKGVAVSIESLQGKNQVNYLDIDLHRFLHDVPNTIPGEQHGIGSQTAIDWIQIRGGAFIMGSQPGTTAADRDEMPAHRVKISSFKMAKTEVTLRQYNACVKAQACTAIDTVDCLSGAFFADGNQPAVCVTWHQARAFSKWVGGRLPTEAEWEYAARSGGKNVAYPWGSEEPISNKATFNAQVTRPVCSRPQGDTDQKLCDIAGNVWEWVEDAYRADYEGAPKNGRPRLLPPWAPYRVMRGGSWSSPGISLRVANRAHDLPNNRFKGGVGFRPVISN